MERQFFRQIWAINDETNKIVRYNHKTPHNNYLYIWMELGILGLGSTRFNLLFSDKRIKNFKWRINYGFTSNNVFINNVYRQLLFII